MAQRRVGEVQWPYVAVLVKDPYCLVFRAALGAPGGRWFAGRRCAGVRRAHRWNACLYRVSMREIEPSAICG